MSRNLLFCFLRQFFLLCRYFKSRYATCDNCICYGGFYRYHQHSSIIFFYFIELYNIRLLHTSNQFFKQCRRIQNMQSHLSKSSNSELNIILGINQLNRINRPPVDIEAQCSVYKIQLCPRSRLAQCSRHISAG